MRFAPPRVLDFRFTALLLTCTLAGTAHGQSPAVVTVEAGEEYRAGSTTRWLLGDDYRDLWTMPMRVPVIDLRSFAGGLTPVSRGSGKQTRSLRFQAANGREYNFRSVNKDQTGGLHPDFQNTLIDWVAQDQVHSKYPAAGLVTHEILDAAGVLHPEPVLYVMSDDPILGEFRAEFAGMLGTIEVHPNESEGGAPSFANAAEIADTEDMLDHLEESASHRVDSREFLKARLLDLFMGDWDRHVDQWRWARFERGGVHWWLPVPEDRDNAFSDHDGVFLDIIRPRASHLVEFGPRYPNLFGLTANAQPLDRPLLSDLPREVFDSIAVDLQRRVTDAVIDSALAHAPPEYTGRTAELAGYLRARRAGLPDIANRFYEHLSHEVTVRTTDEDEVAEIDRRPDGSIDVRIFAGESRSQPYYRRTILPSDTREIRLYLRGGDDRAVIRGTAPTSPLVRVIGGGGTDVLVDSSTVSDNRARAAFYDDDDDTEFVAPGRTVVDTRELLVLEDEVGGFNENAPANRDWGVELEYFRAFLDWRTETGFIVGGGPVFTRYGFHRFPFARQVFLRGMVSPREGRFGGQLGAVVQRTNSLSRMTVLASASQLELSRFHGYGNETTSELDSETYEIWNTEYLLAPLYHAVFSDDFEIFLGPLARYVQPKPEVGSPADVLQPFGSDTYGSVGGQIGAELDTRDLPAFPRRGIHSRVVASLYGAMGGHDSYGDVDASVAAYLALPIPLETTVAARLGGRLARGDYPLQGAAFVGGSGSIRGVPTQRYTGDTSIFGGLEIRSYLTRFNFISRGDLGVLALGDAGRVYFDGESPGDWHHGVGGGLWVGVLDRTRTFSLVYAHGENDGIYFSFGMPF